MNNLISRNNRLMLAVMMTMFALTVTAFQQQREELYEPLALLLTWQQDPTTTMTIDWHTVPGVRRPQPASILYREEGSDGEWKKKPGTMHPFPYTSRTINRVELTGLKPGTTYEFRIGPAPTNRYPFPQSKIYKFRTMPEKLDRPLKIAVGGDTGADDDFRQVAKQTRGLDLDFVVIGGDIAYVDGGDRDWRMERGEFSYADGNESKRRWTSWFDIVRDEFITDDGRAIPFILGIGNHEVWMGYARSHPEYEQTDVWRERIAPLYYNIFAFPGQPGYAALDFSDYLSFILLDSGHSNPVEGEQTEWLEQTLAERANIPHVYPFYHIASYPTVRPYDGTSQVEIRENWAPLFDKNNLDVVFENHDHTYKRTHPIRNNQIDPAGIVYLGDGAFGRGDRGDRMHDVEETWYLNRAAPDRHFILLTLDANGSRFEAINEDGDIIDRFPEDGGFLNRLNRQ